MKLAEKLVQVMQSVENIPKNGFNEYHQYAFAQEADILRAVRGKLAELGVLVLTSIDEAKRQGDLTEVSTIHIFLDAETGEKLEVKGYGQGQDKNDKGGPKAITSAVKYFLTKNLLLPTGDDPEQDQEQPKEPQKNEKPEQNGQQNGKQQPRSPDASTPHQQDKIQKMAKELNLDVHRDILPKVKSDWPPNRETADRILKRLTELKSQRARA